jgi:hypothetical protein
VQGFFLDPLGGCGKGTDNVVKEEIEVMFESNILLRPATGVFESIEHVLVPAVATGLRFLHPFAISLVFLVVWSVVKSKSSSISQLRVGNPESEEMQPSFF